MKTLFSTLIIILLATSFSFAQKFKVTGFTGTDKRFEETEATLMGQTVNLIVYDTSISLKVGDEKADIIHKVSDNIYVLDLSKPNSTETQKLTVKLNKLIGYINSIEVTFYVAENKGAYRTASWTLTAKRD
jgi:hypothetical protein